MLNTSGVASVIFPILLAAFAKSDETDIVEKNSIEQTAEKQKDQDPAVFTKKADTEANFALNEGVEKTGVGEESPKFEEPELAVNAEGSAVSSDEGEKVVEATDATETRKDPALDVEIEEEPELTVKVDDLVAPVDKTGTKKGEETTAKVTVDDMDPNIKKIIQRGTLRIGVCKIDQPPFHVKVNGKLSGFDITLAKDLAKSLGVSVTFIESPDWDGMIPWLINGKIDLIISNLTLTPERAARISCSTPYAKIRQCMLLNRVLLTREKSRGFTTLRQIFTDSGNRDLVAEAGTVYTTVAITLFPKARVIAVKEWPNIMAKIRSRESIGTISDEIEIKQQLKKANSVELMSVVLKGKYDLISVGVSRESPQLLHFVNSYITCNNIECNVEDF
jgi:polar amino acid transport system substrate-binding protein